jgi:hypothetical protein
MGDYGCDQAKRPVKANGSIDARQVKIACRIPGQRTRSFRQPHGCSTSEQRRGEYRP